IAYRLYLPKDWAADPARRKKAGVPEEVTFRTKPEIALDQIRAALEAGAPPGVVLKDAGYGADTSLRSALAGLGLAYVAGVQPHTAVWKPAFVELDCQVLERARPPREVLPDARDERFTRVAHLRRRELDHALRRLHPTRPIPVPL